MENVLDKKIQSLINSNLKIYKNHFRKNKSKKKKSMRDFKIS